MLKMDLRPEGCLSKSTSPKGPTQKMPTKGPPQLPPTVASVASPRPRFRASDFAQAAALYSLALELAGPGVGRPLVNPPTDVF